MVKAIIKNGSIQPLGPIPKSWREGQELEIKEAEAGCEPEDDGSWREEFRALSGQITPDDHVRMAEALARQRKESKDYVGQQMGLT